MMAPLAAILKGLVRSQHARVVDHTGIAHDFGRRQSAPPATMRLHDRWLPLKMALRPDLATAEAYMDGRLTLENTDILTLLDRLLCDRTHDGLKDWALAFLRLVPKLTQWNPRGRSRANVAHHYDLSTELYQLFLDDQMQYSCAYFPHRDATLEDAQLHKIAHIARKLCLDQAPGKDPLRILDIGCGWGTLGLALHNASGAQVLGITLSEEQIKFANKLAQQQAPQSVSFRMMDYRDVSDQFDRIVSVGMFEHVGTPHYQAFFNKVHGLLADDGVALLHTIGRAHGPGITDAFTRKYIFPGGYIPALSEIMPAIERSGLVATDIEMLRLQYAYTLEHWYARCVAQKAKIVALYDERFWRMWSFYLAAAVCSFRYSGLEVFQIQLAKRMAAVPLTRDYLYKADH